MAYMPAEAQQPAGVPTAPPRAHWDGPPDYDTVVDEAERNPPRTLTRGITDSLQYAGASIGRWFGVHDEDLAGWRRTGTLPQSERIASYSLISPEQEDPAAAVELQPRQRGARGGGEGERERRRPRERRSTIRRITDTLTRRKPTREEVKETLPTFWPVFTILVAIIEIGLLAATIITGGGLAPIAFRPKSEHQIITDFNNQSQVSVTREIVPNFFIGPSSAALVHTGAKYTPCMRENIEFQINAARDLLEESQLRCCKGGPPYEQCGMLPAQTCTSQYDGTVLGGASVCRAEVNETDQCVGGVVLHPCCVGLLGECIITTEENCTFQEGYWHPDKVVCSEVGTDCFKDICEFSWIGRTIGQTPSQGIRFLAAIFLYDGVIHLLLIGLLKLYISWKIERRIGWLRIMCVYLISGIGGFLLSGIFDPTKVSVGSSGSLFGLYGVLILEVLQGWKWVRRPGAELFKILLIVIFLLALGTIPYIDNFSQIGGFIFGFFASFIFVPYITIGKWDRAKKLGLVLIAFPIILALYFVGFLIFYNLPNPDFCPKCSYINCIPYTATFCEDFLSAFSSLVPGG